ncbi:hypothetical protein SCALM49S_03837 [Streptomyces californicus]
MAKTDRASHTVTWWPRNLPARTNAAAKSTAPNTIIRGGSTLDSTSRVSPPGQCEPSSERAMVPVRPVSSRAAAPAAAVRSSSGWPPSPPSAEPSARTSSARPSNASGPSTTRARAAGPPATAAASAARSTSRCGESARTGVTMMSRTPPQVSPTAKASSSL